MYTNMQEEYLQQYRCTSCNKLLFKGSLIISTVEIKCRKCGMISLFNVLDNQKQRDDSAAFLINSQGTIVNTGAISTAMAGSQRTLIGTQLSTLLDILDARECIHSLGESLKNPVMNKISQLSSQLNDGRELTLKWHFIRRSDQLFAHVRLRLAAMQAAEEVTTIQPATATATANLATASS